MSAWRGWCTRLRRAFDRKNFEREMLEEMREHMDLEAARLKSLGEDATLAKRDAAIAFGSLVSRVEQVRDRRLGRWADESIQDLRHALRVLRKAPGFTFIAITTLALCIGGNVAIFSLLRSILLQPYPYPEIHRVVNLGMVWPKWPWGDKVQEISPLTFLEIEASAKSFSALGFVDAAKKADLHLQDRVLRLDIGRVTAGVWAVAEVKPLLGRNFDEQDLASGQGDLVVLSHQLWSDVYGQDTSILGRKVQLDNRSYHVIGVMPSGFSIAANRAKLWIPKIFSADERSEKSRGDYAFQAIARLADGVSIEQARHELEALSASYLSAHPEVREFTEQTGQKYGVARVSEWVGDRASGKMLVSLQSASGLILLLGCLNIAGLLIVRGHGRVRELALRSALGATRRRIARQLATETVVLFFFGGAAGALLSTIALRYVPQHFQLGETMPYGQQITIDGGILALAFGVALVAGVLTGLLPLLFATSGARSGALQALSTETTSSKTRGWAQSSFVVAQVALAFVLLTASILTIRNLRSLLSAGFGVATEQRLVASVALPAYRYGSDDQAMQQKIYPFREQALERLRALPGVIEASAANRVPLSGDWPQKFGFGVPGYQPAASESPSYSFAYAVNPRFFRTLGMPLIEGRDFEASDKSASPSVVVISKLIADRYFRGRGAIGEEIAFLGRACVIVGVVGDAQHVPLSMGNAPAIYLSAPQWPPLNEDAVLVVHTALEPEALGPTVAAALTAIDPLLSVRLTNLTRQQKSAVRTQSTPMEVTGIFALIAVLLTTLGLYGVLASSVAQRKKELGIRIALGAPHRAILRTVLGRGVALALGGCVLGAGLALPLLHWVEPVLATRTVSRADTLMYATVAILSVSLLAAYLPARRATRVDPLMVLRND